MFLKCKLIRHIGTLYILFILPIISIGAVKELRGIGLNLPPDEKEIIQILETIKQARFNVIFLEIFHNGMTLYPGKIFNQNPDFQETDYLEFFIREAHKRNLEVHGRIHVLSWKENNFESPLLTKQPDWLDVSKSGEKSGGWVNPSLPKTREMLNNLLKEILEIYLLDGILLEDLCFGYNLLEYKYGYHPLMMSKFKNKYHIDPLILDPQKTPKGWTLWNQFRDEQILELLRIFRKTMKKISPHIKLSVVLYPEEKNHLNYSQWTKEKGLIDAFVPLCYSYSSSEIIQWIREVKSYSGTMSLYPGLLIKKDNLHPDIPPQIEILRQENPSGHILFDYDGLLSYPGIMDILAKDIYKEPSILW